jgi:hypothetical protein
MALFFLADLWVVVCVGLFVHSKNKQWFEVEV